MLVFCLLPHRERTGLNNLGQVWGRNIEQVTPEWWLSKEISGMRTQKSVELLSKLLEPKAVSKPSTPQVCIRAREFHSETWAASPAQGRKAKPRKNQQTGHYQVHLSLKQLLLLESPFSPQTASKEGMHIYKCLHQPEALLQFLPPLSHSEAFYFLNTSSTSHKPLTAT